MGSPRSGGPSEQHWRPLFSRPWWKHRQVPRVRVLPLDANMGQRKIRSGPTEHLQLTIYEGEAYCFIQSATLCAQPGRSGTAVPTRQAVFARIGKAHQLHSPMSWKTGSPETVSAYSSQQT